MLKVIVAAIYLVPALAAAQSLTPEEIEAMVNQRINSLNPYQELLNDPDPARSLAAMEIMLESGDVTLERMALEYGLLSPNPTVKRRAFEGFLGTGPTLSIRFDGTDLEDGWYASTIKSNWSGALQSDGTGYWKIPVGSYLEDQQCFANTYRPEQCFITVNGDGVFLTPDRMNARGSISETAELKGEASLHNVGTPVSFSVKLLD